MNTATFKRLKVFVQIFGAPAPAGNTVSVIVYEPSESAVVLISPSLPPTTGTPPPPGG